MAVLQLSRSTILFTNILLNNIDLYTISTAKIKNNVLLTVKGKTEKMMKMKVVAMTLVSGEHNDVEDHVDDNHQEQGADEIDLQDIQRGAASFLLKVRERNKIPQSAMTDIMASTTCLVDQVLTYIKNKVIANLEPCGKNHQAELLEALDNISAPFSGIETKTQHYAYIKKNFKYVRYKKICLGTRYVREKKGPKRLICTQDESLAYIPILESLQQLLANNKIASIILKKPECCEKSVFYDICDGAIFQNDKYFKDHPDALVIILYHDELEICNPLGSKAGTHKLDMFYYTLANFGPKLS